MIESLAMLEKVLDTLTGQERFDLLVNLSLLNFKVSPAKARSYAEEALVHALSDRSRKKEALALNALGKAYLGQLNHIEALKHLHRALSIFEEEKSKNRIAEVLGNIGLVHHSSGENADALEYFERSLKLHEELGDRKQLANIMNSKGLALLSINRSNEALKYLEDSLRIASEEDDDKTVRSATNNMGILHYKNGKFEEAVKCFKRAAVLSEEQGELRSLAGNYINIGTCNIQLQQPEMAREYLKRGIETAKQSEAMDFMVQGYHSLCELSELEGDFKAALDLHRKTGELEKKLFSIEKSKAIAEIEARYQIETTEQEAEINRLRNIELVEKKKLIEAQAESLQRANVEISVHKEELLQKNRELEKLLKEKDEFLSRMVDHISDGVMIDDKEGKILYANDQFLNIFGFSRGDLSHMDPFRVVAPEWRSRVRAYHERRIAGEDVPDRFEFEGIKKGGGRLWLEVGSTVVVRDGVVQGTQSLVRDITGKKNLEAQLLQSQKLDAIGRLAGGIAHDFNNLLTVIKGHCEFILSDLSETHPLWPDAVEIRKATDRASSLTRQLLAFSRQQVLQPRIINVSSIISGLQRMLSRLLSEDIQLETSFSSEDGCVLADESQIEQVIVNLVINARDAMESGGKLTIDVDNVDVTDISLVINPDLEPGRYVRISISDTGKGMDEDTQARIFEPFYSTKISEHGSGLGLAMVYGIIKQSKGVIEVSSEPEVGTTFKIYLPRMEGEYVPEETDSSQNTELGNGETILLVEDDNALRNLATRHLTQEGYSVIPAGSAEKAVDIFEESGEKIDMLLTDIVLPGINGVILATLLREGGFSGPTLYITGYTEDHILPTDIKKGDMELLEKPFSLTMLSQRVRIVLDL